MEMKIPTRIAYFYFMQIMFLQFLRIELVFSDVEKCAVKRFGRTKTRNKMASRANKEKLKEKYSHTNSHATPRHSTNTIIRCC